MPRFFQLVFSLILFFPQYLFAQQSSPSQQTQKAEQIVHHEILAQITPEKHEIKIIDVITLEKGKSSMAFILHDGEMPKIQGKSFQIKKLSVAEQKIAFPEFAGQRTTQDVPVAAYRIVAPNARNKVTLEYTLNINHAVSSGGEEYERSISDSPGLILPKGVYLAGESLWYPRFENELVSFRLSVRLPGGWKSVSQGERQYVEDEKSYHLDTWVEKKAQDDIYLIAARFTEYSQAAGSVNAMAFLRDADEALAQKYLDVTAQYLEMYRSLLGPYPYTKFALVENFWETGFGMPSFTLLGSKIIRFPFILHSSYPHELLHNWWGNSVYVNYEEGNWAEGLTAYLADHLIKEQKGRGVLHRRAVLQKYTNFTQAGGDFPLKDFVSRYDAVTEAVGYGKTMMMFHMLRQKLGDEVFSRGLRKFYMKNRYKVAGYSDIESTFSQVSGKNLKPFFNAWVGRTGAPDLKLGNVSVVEQDAGKYKLTAKLTQNQAEEAYALNVPVAVSVKGKKSSVQKVLSMRDKSLMIEMTFDAEPQLIEIDPEFDLFRRLDLNETPPSLSQAFGAAASVIIISSAESAKMKAAYEAMAKSWQDSQAGKISIGFDTDFSKIPSDKAVWLLGENNKFKSKFMTVLSEYPFSENEKALLINKEKLKFDANSIVLVGRNPVNPKYALAYISADQVAAVSGLARKLPHYGKYSYLGFDGDAPTNMAKGQWPIVNSPLSSQIVKSDFKVSLAERKPLIELSPVFSQKRMMEHVRILADEKMKGRGAGSAELDKAAEYISTQFKTIGLDSIDDDYFQSWRQKLDDGRNVRFKNVIGVLPGSNPKYKGESVIVSAHYDHLGLEGFGVKEENAGKIHYGADDNASGVSIMIELAQLMAKKGQPERTVLFIAFAGEELNRLGSRYYVKNTGQFPLKKIMGVVNLDTVGRLGKNPLSIFSTNSASEWVHIFRGAGFVTGVNVKSIPKNIGASDDEIFNDAGVPAVQFFSGVNADFHRPTDTVDKIDGQGLVKVASVLKETVDYLAAREDPLTSQLKAAEVTNGSGNVTKLNSKSGQRPGKRRVSLGTIPDFAYQGEGIKVSDVVKGSPAEKAGILANDIILKINNNRLAGLREFSQYLRKLSPGDSIKIVLNRGGKTIELTAVVKAH